MAMKIMSKGPIDCVKIEPKDPIDCINIAQTKKAEITAGKYSIKLKKEWINELPPNKLHELIDDNMLSHKSYLLIAEHSNNSDILENLVSRHPLGEILHLVVDNSYINSEILHLLVTLNTKNHDFSSERNEIDELIAKHPKAQARTLSKLLRKAPMLVAKHPNASSESLAELSRNSQSLVRKVIASRIAPVAGVFEFLARDIDIEVKAALLDNPLIDESTINLLAKDDSLDLLLRVASRAKLSTECVKTLLEKNHVEIKQVLCLNDSLEGEVVELLLPFLEIELVRVLARHPNLNANCMNFLLNTNDESVIEDLMLNSIVQNKFELSEDFKRRIRQRKVLSQQEINDILNADLTAGLDILSKNSKIPISSIENELMNLNIVQVEAIAKNPETPTKFLHLLRNHQNRIVLVEIAKNINTCFETLNFIAHKEDSIKARNIAIKRISKRNYRQVEKNIDGQTNLDTQYDGKENDNFLFKIAVVMFMLTIAIIIMKLFS